MSDTTGVNNNVQYWITSTTTPGGATYTTYTAHQRAGFAFVPISALCPSTHSIEEAGIRAGEIIAYRCWRIGPRMELTSFSCDYVWKPGGIERVPYVDPYHGAGLYAFKAMDRVKEEFGGLGVTLVFGEVALWGEVIEHEWGYRAEFAKITRLNECKGSLLLKRIMLARLRRKYGV